MLIRCLPRRGNGTGRRLLHFLPNAGALRQFSLNWNVVPPPLTLGKVRSYKVYRTSHSVGK